MKLTKRTKHLWWWSRLGMFANVLGSDGSVIGSESGASPSLFGLE